MATGVYKDTVIGVRIGEVRALDGKMDPALATDAEKTILPGQLVTAVGDLAVGNGVVYLPSASNHKFTKAAAGKVRGLCVVLNSLDQELRHVREDGKSGPRKKVSDPYLPGEQLRAAVIKAGDEYTFIIGGTAAVANGALLAVGADGMLVAASGGNEVASAIETMTASATGDNRRILCRVL